MKKSVFLVLALLILMLLPAAAEAPEIIELKMTIDSAQVFLNGEAQTLDAAARLFAMASLCCRCALLQSALVRM